MCTSHQPRHFSPSSFMSHSDLHMPAQAQTHTHRQKHRRHFFNLFMSSLHPFLLEGCGFTSSLFSVDSLLLWLHFWLHRIRAMRFTNFFGYFSPFFVSAFPRTHPRRIKWGLPVLLHSPPGEWQAYSLVQRWASSSHTCWLRTFHTKSLVLFRNFFPIMQ